MKKDNLSKKLTYKEAIDKYDVEFITQQAAKEQTSC